MRKDILERRAKRLEALKNQRTATPKHKPKPKPIEPVLREPTEEEKQYPRTLGLWKNGERIISSGIYKGDIPKYCRLLIMKNRYKKKEGQPDYIGVFVEVKDKDALVIKHPFATLRSHYAELENEE